MRENNWLRITILFLTCVPLVLAKFPESLAETPSKYSPYLAKISAYDRYMALGYAATSRRDYRKALGYFQQALQARPGDRYARAAINNVQGYINRRSRSQIQIIAGRATRITAGSSRGEICRQSHKIIIPILPTPQQEANSNQDSQVNVAEAPKTSEAYPTFFFYVPVNDENKPELFIFSLSADKQGTQSIFYQKYKPIDKSGIVSISIPPNAKPLEAGKEYTWNFYMICDRNDFSNSSSVTGQIQHAQIDPGLKDFLQSLQGLEKVGWYASSGYWEDALRELTKLPRNDENLQAWKELLESANVSPEAIQGYPPIELEAE